MNNILVIFPNYIGDAIMTTPALRKISEIYPSSRIVAVVSETGYPALKHNPRISDFALRPTRFSGAGERIKFIKIVKSKCQSGDKFDVAYVFRDTFFNRMLSYLSARRRFIIKTGAAVLPESYKAAAIRTVVRGDDIEPDAKDNPVKTEFYLSCDDINSADEFIAANSLERFAVIHPRTSRPAKNWSKDKFASLAAHILLKYGLKTVFTGSVEDRDYIKDIIRLSAASVSPSVTESEESFVNASGVLSLGGTSAVISRAHFVITCDTGIMHIAYTLGRKTVALFGSTHPDRYGPYPENFNYIYKNACSPCYKNICPLEKESNAAKNPLCMDAIDTKDVFEVIDKLLAE